jgi:multidrug efflux pump subunit AcrB
VNKLDRANRLAGTLVAVALIAVGVLGLLRSYGVIFSDAAMDDPVLLRQVRDWVADNDAWFWWVAFLVALLLAYLGYRWLRVQLLPSPSVGELTVASTDTGRTTLPARALSDAVTRQLEDDPEVTGARVRLVGSEGSPSLDIRASVADGADLEGVRARLEDDAVGRARQALERADLTASVRYRLGDPTQRVVT